MRPLKELLFCTLLSGLFAIFAESSFACTCMATSDIDREIRSAANIALLKVQSMEKVEGDPQRLGNLFGIKQTTLTVENVFKGELKLGQKLVLAQGSGADCIFTFASDSIGQEFLFYLGAGPGDPSSVSSAVSRSGRFPVELEKNAWIASSCSRSGPLKYTSSDVRYLKNFEKLRAKTRISGTVIKYHSAALEGDAKPPQIVEGHKIFLRGRGRPIELRTDDNGVFEIYDLPSGEYTISADGIDGYSVRYRSSERMFKLAAGRKVEQNFSFGIENLVQGKLVNSQGSSLRDVCLDLEPIGGKPARGFFQHECTDAAGQFLFKEVPAGTYIIVANKKGRESASAPFATTYYPGTTKREEAGEITVGPGTRLEGLNIKVAETVETIKVRGVIVYEDGKPAGDIFETSIGFYLSGEEEREAVSVTNPSKATGEFEISVLRGQRGNIRGTRLVYRDDHGKCPKLDRLLDPEGEGSGVVTTQSISIDGVSDVSDIRLVLPFPSCSKRKN